MYSLALSKISRFSQLLPSQSSIKALSLRGNTYITALNHIAVTTEGV